VKEVLTNALECKEYMFIRSALILLSKVAPEFPILQSLGQPHLQRVQSIESAEDGRGDLKLMAKSLMSLLKKYSAQWKNDETSGKVGKAGGSGPGKAENNTKAAAKVTDSSTKASSKAPDSSVKSISKAADSNGKPPPKGDNSAKVATKTDNKTAQKAADSNVKAASQGTDNGVKGALKVTEINAKGTTKATDNSASLKPAAKAAVSEMKSGSNVSGGEVSKGKQADNGKTGNNGKSSVPTTAQATITDKANDKKRKADDDADKRDTKLKGRDKDSLKNTNDAVTAVTEPAELKNSAKLPGEPSKVGPDSSSSSSSASMETSSSGRKDAGNRGGDRPKDRGHEKSKQTAATGTSDNIPEQKR
jgi:hypothetical protein